MQHKENEVRLADYKVPAFLIDSVNLTFDLDEETTHVLSTLAMRRNPDSTETPKDLILVGEDLKLLTVKLNGDLLTSDKYEVTEHSLTIRDVPAKFILQLQNSINPTANTELSGLYTAKGNFITQCEAEGFRRITYFLDRPDVMTIYTTTLIADAKKFPVLLSNGNLLESGTFSTGRHWVTYEDPFKKPSYLFALVGGDFELLEDHFITMSGRKIKLKIYSEKGYGERLKFSMDALKQAMKWDEDNFGRECDLDEYKIVATSAFNMGAMENKGLNIFNAKSLLSSPETTTDTEDGYIAGTVSHEYFHNYRGNRVGPKNWFQLTSKEGLTTFTEQLFSEDVFGVTSRIDDVNYLQTYQFPEDAGPLAHSVQPQSYLAIDNFYTTTVYYKGAEIFRMLHTLLGKETFRTGMDIYFKELDGKSATVEDIVHSMEKASGRDLTQFLSWFRQVGTPIVTVKDEYDPATQTYKLKISQSCNPPMMIPVRMGLIDRASHAASHEQVLELTEKEQTFIFENVSAKPIPSLLRHFSAPVKLDYAYTNDELRLLAQHDTDQFNRWQAAQRYIMRNLLALIKDYQQGKKIRVSSQFIDFFSQFGDAKTDPDLLATLLSLPTEDEIAKLMDVIDPAAIVAVRQIVKKNIAEAMETTLQSVYFSHFATKSSGARALKNLCLSYLATLDRPEITSLIQDQFRIAKNMTDTVAALQSISSKDCEQRSQVLDAFYQQWQADPIVLTKWFSVQAASTLPTTMQRVRELLDHPAFDIKNPNSVRALVRPFVRNYACFHADSGEGYQLISDLVLRLNSINANLAADLCEYFADWRKFAEPQKELMQQQLRRILAQEGLSKNVFEIASKSLGEQPKAEEKPTSVVVEMPGSSVGISSTFFQQPPEESDTITMTSQTEISLSSHLSC